MLKVLVVVFEVIVAFSYVLCIEDGFRLQVVHLNDFHARFEETSLLSTTCKTNCIGGFSRIYTVVHRIKTENPNAIVLNAGDNFQGSLWYNVYKWNVTQHFLNMLPTDAYTFGNHEFDDKIKGVVPFVEALNAPTVTANIDDSQEPSIQGTYNKSLVIKRNGKKIGVIGVIFSGTNQITNSENLKFLDESESVNQEAERLVAQENVDTIIVLSHAGYEVDQKIAKRASPKIGLIVGGHSHSFLYTGEDHPSGETPEGPYPTIIHHEDGRQILVVQAYAFSKFLGNISVQYNNNGDVVSWSGEPIYLDSKIPQDEAVNKELAIWKKGLEQYGGVSLGQTKVFLDRASCRFGECNLGNFLADSMVYAYLDTDEDEAWTSAAIAVTNPGGIRASIDMGNITFTDMVTSQPFENTLDVGEIQGKYIKDFLEYSAVLFTRQRTPFGKIQSNHNLLQVSGIRVVYNVTNPLGCRVQSAKIRCRKCLVPKYEPLDFNKFYRIVVNSFVGRGGDGFTSISENLVSRKIGPRDIDVLQEYIRRESPIIKPLDGRIEVVT